MTWFEQFAARFFSAELLTVLSCDNFPDPDPPRPFFKLNIKTYQFTLLCKNDQFTHQKQQKSFY